MKNVKIDMTPLVDVCMSLLIVFMVSGSIMMEPAIKVDPPQAVTNEEKEEQDKVIIYISKEGEYAIDEQLVSLDAMQSVLNHKIRRIESGTIVIKADKGTAHGNLLDAMSRAKKAHAKKVTIATVQKKEAVGE